MSGQGHPGRRCRGETCRVTWPSLLPVTTQWLSGDHQDIPVVSDPQTSVTETHSLAATCDPAASRVAASGQQMLLSREHKHFLEEISKLGHQDPLSLCSKSVPTECHTSCFSQNVSRLFLSLWSWLPDHKSPQCAASELRQVSKLSSEDSPFGVTPRSAIGPQPPGLSLFIFAAQELH